MRLYDVKPILTEGLVPIHYFMILREVMKAGKITNTVQTVLMSYLIQHFKYDTVQNIRNLNEHPPMGDLVNFVRNLPAEDQVELAQWLFDNLKIDENPTCYIDPHMELSEWVRWVLHKNDE